MSQTKYPRTVADIPKTPHWQILFSDSYAEHDHYDNSSSNRPYLSIESYLEKTEWEARIQQLEADRSMFGRKEYVAVEVNPAQITRTVSVVVNKKIPLSQVHKYLADPGR